MLLFDGLWEAQLTRRYISVGRSEGVNRYIMHVLYQDVGNDLFVIPCGFASCSIRACIFCTIVLIDKQVCHLNSKPFLNLYVASRFGQIVRPNQSSNN